MALRAVGSLLLTLAVSATMSACSAAVITPSATIASTASPRLVDIDPYLQNDGFGKVLAFDSPSHNIHCGIIGATDPHDSIYGCAVDHYTFKDSPPPTCAQEIPYGGDLKAAFDGAVSDVCHGGVDFDGQAKRVPVLARGSSITFEQIVCISYGERFTCHNSRNGAGFDISASAFKIQRPSN